MADERVRQSVERYFSAISALDCTAWVTNFAPDGEMRDPAHAPPVRGHDQLRAYFDGVTGLFRTIDITPDEIYICGDTAAVRWSLGGVGANGQSVCCAGIDLFEVDGEGKIRSEQGYWDPAAMLAQLQG